MAAQKPKDHAKRKIRRHYLIAFSFDYAIVSQNSDTTVRELLSEEKVQRHLGDLVDVLGWTKYMDCVFRELNKRKITPEQILEVVHNIPEVPGIIEALKRLHASGKFDLIIISDSNAVFVREWLRVHDLADCFLKIYTNPAHFDETGLLTVRALHRQTHCKLSAKNLCKKVVLEGFLANQRLHYNHRYDRVFYVGCGIYDVCPILRLRSGDVAFARERYGLEDALRKKEKHKKLRASFLTWKDGFDLLEKFEEIIEGEMELQTH